MASIAVSSSRKTRRKAKGQRGAKSRGLGRTAGRLLKRGKTNGVQGKLPAGEWFEKLVALQTQLRAPGGCPWDREQTHESLRKYMVEETYEVLDAMEAARDAQQAGREVRVFLGERTEASRIF